jgi:hypothetical protein
MNYGEVLSKSWKIVWKHKALWIFGILAGCGSGGGGGGGGSNLNYSFQQGDLPPAMENFFRQFERIPDWQIAMGIAAMVLFVLLLIVVVIFFSTIGRIGLIRGAQQADADQPRITFGSLFRESLAYFWRVFGLNLLLGIAIFLIVGLLIAMGIVGAVATLGVLLICLIPLMCLFVPLMWLVSILVEQANIAIVVENTGIIEGLKRGWQVFRDNLGTMIVMGLILILGVGLVGGFIIGLPLILIVLPAMVGVFMGTQSSLGGGLLVAGLCLVAYLPIWLVLTGILTSYTKSAWTLTYLRLTKGPAVVELAPAEAAS